MITDIRDAVKNYELRPGAPYFADVMVGSPLAYTPAARTALVFRAGSTLAPEHLIPRGNTLRHDIYRVMCFWPPSTRNAREDAELELDTLADELPAHVADAAGLAVPEQQAVEVEHIAPNGSRWKALQVDFWRPVLPMTCSLQRFTATSTDAYGHPTGTWGTLASSACYWWEGEEEELEGPTVTGIISKQFLVVPDSTPVTAADRVASVTLPNGATAGQNLNIRGVRRRLNLLVLNLEAQEAA